MRSRANKPRTHQMAIIRIYTARHMTSPARDVCETKRACKYHKKLCCDCLCLAASKKKSKFNGQQFEEIRRNVWLTEIPTQGLIYPNYYNEECAEHPFYAFGLIRKLSSTNFPYHNIFNTFP